MDFCVKVPGAAAKALLFVASKGKRPSSAPYQSAAPFKLDPVGVSTQWPGELLGHRGARPRLGSENLVEDGFCLVLVGLLGKCEL